MGFYGFLTMPFAPSTIGISMGFYNAIDHQQKEFMVISWDINVGIRMPLAPPMAGNGEHTSYLW